MSITTSPSAIARRQITHVRDAAPGARAGCIPAFLTLALSPAVVMAASVEPPPIVAQAFREWRRGPIVLARLLCRHAFAGNEAACALGCLRHLFGGELCP
jgi:hypothetical protein